MTHHGYSVSLSDDGSEVAIGAQLVMMEMDLIQGMCVSTNGMALVLGLSLVRILMERLLLTIRTSVSLSSDGTIVAIGAYRNDGGGSNSGHVRVYEYSGSSWSSVRLGY